MVVDLDHADVALLHLASSSGRGSGRARRRAGLSCGRGLRCSCTSQRCTRTVVGCSSGWKATARMLPWRTATGCPSTSASTSTPSPASSTHGARMNTARSGPDPPRLEVGLERSHLAAERVAPARSRRAAEVVAVEHDQAGAGAEHGLARARPARAAARPGPRARCRASSSSTRRRGYEPVEPSRSAGRAHLARRRRRARAAPSRAPRSRPGGRGPRSWRSLLTSRGVWSRPPLPGLERRDLEPGHRRAQAARGGRRRARRPRSGSSPRRSRVAVRSGPRT